MASNDVAGTSSSGSEVNHMHNTNNGAGVKVMVEQQTQSISGNLSSDSKMETPSGRESMNQVNVNIVPQELSRYRNGSTGGTMDFSHDVPSNSSAEAQHLCKICNVTFTSLDTLTMHHLVHTMNKETMGDDMISDMEQSKLEEVGGAFSHPGNSSHLPEMLNHERYPHLYCDICNLGFKEFLDFQSHQETVHEYRKPFECLFCRESFSSGAELQEHSKVHKGSKPFQCDICNREFADLSKLRGHEKLHAAGKFYPCSVCPKSFRNKVRLKQHEQSHSKVCILCKESFDDFESLREHAKDIHGMGEPTRCKDLGKMMSEEIQGIKSMKTDRDLICKECGETFRSQIFLKLHHIMHQKERATISSLSEGREDASMSDDDAMDASSSENQECGSEDMNQSLPSSDSDSDGEVPYQDSLLKIEISEELSHCPECGEVFSDLMQLQVHREAVHHIVLFPCTFCTEVFPELTLLQQHSEIHHDLVNNHVSEGKAHKCSVCLKSFVDKYHLRIHESRHTGSLSFKCSICPKTFDSWTKLERHFYVHTGERPHKCSQCPKSFREPYKLKVHEKMHEDSTPFSCSVCSANFHTIYTLKKHEEDVHGKIPKVPYSKSCQLCGKSFQYTSQLEMHMFKHQENRPCKCPFCPKTFTNKYHLKTHQNRHTGELKYKCDLCTKAFDSRPKLVSHLYIHTGERPHKCEKCPKAFRDVYKLREHQRSHELPVSYTCLVCKDAFPTQTDLQDHVKEQHLSAAQIDMQHQTKDRYGRIKIIQAEPSKENIMQSFSREKEEQENYVKESNDEDKGEIQKCGESHGEGGNKIAKADDDNTKPEIKKEADDCENTFVAVEASYVCAICGASFMDVGSWTEHTDSHVKQEVCEVKSEDEVEENSMEEQSSEHILPDRGFQSTSSTTSRELTMELKLEIVESSYKCKECNNITFGSLDELKEHREKVHNYKLHFFCNICFEMFSDQLTYETHDQSHPVSEKPHKCDKCGKGFADVYKLRAHEKIHSGVTYKCPLCPKVFTLKHNLKRHQELHTEGGSYVCSICHQSFPTVAELELHHKEDHIGAPLSYICSTCGKDFKYDFDLKSHQYQHSGKDKPYKCSMCPKSYLNKYNLNRHIQMHQSGKKYTCKMCQQTFDMVSFLKKHEEEAHGNKTSSSNICTICERAFRCKTELTTHLYSHSGKKPFKCDKCSKSFADKYYLNIHRSRHVNELSFKCAFCNKSFDSRSKLQVHHYVHTGERPFMCSKCAKTFRDSYKLKEHERSHDQSNLFVCLICSRPFPTHYQLERHVKLHNKRRGGKDKPMGIEPVGVDSSAKAAS